MMKKVKYAEEKLFYYSSIYGTLFRILNLEYNPELVFAHSIFNNSYNMINARIAALKGGDPAVDFPNEAFDKLADCVQEAGRRIAEDENLLDIYVKISELSYISTGNGYYLMKKGVLKL
jgi:hypothetical protein